MKIMNYWAIFQILLGIWLFVSPFALGFTELTPAALNSMVVGAIVTLTGFGAYLFEIYHRTDVCKLDELEKGES